MLFLEREYPLPVLRAWGVIVPFVPWLSGCLPPGERIDGDSPSWQIIIMIKTQVQIPDHLYREAKRVAAENEMSFAEVVRRGIEKVVQHYPRGRQPAAHWRPPKPQDLGEILAPEEEWTALSHE